MLVMMGITFSLETTEPGDNSDKLAVTRDSNNKPDRYAVSNRRTYIVSHVPLFLLCYMLLGLLLGLGLGNTRITQFRNRYPSKRVGK